MHFPYTGLTMNREKLYKRIDERVESMFNKGLPDEVDALLRAGYQKDGNAMAALGYKEIIPYLEGAYDETFAKELLKKNTRHFAKRQLTWFKRDPRLTWFEINADSGMKSIAEKIIVLEKKECRC